MVNRSVSIELNHNYRKRSCVVPGCFDKYSQRHRFPRDSEDFEIFKIWVERVNNPKLAHMTKQEIYDKGYVICDLHFEDECKTNGKKKIKPRSLPTLRLPSYPPKEPVDIFKIWPAGCVTELSQDPSDFQMVEFGEILRDLNKIDPKLIDVPQDNAPFISEGISVLDTDQNVHAVDSEISIEMNENSTELNTMSDVDQLERVPEDVVAGSSQDTIHQKNTYATFHGQYLEFVTLREENDGTSEVQNEKVDVVVDKTLDVWNEKIDAFVEKPYFKSIKCMLQDSSQIREVCRLCFCSLSDEEAIKLYESISEETTQIQTMLQSVIPDLDLELFLHTVICTKCAELLVYSYQLKQKWLLTEEKMQKIINLKKGVMNRDKDLIIFEKESKTENISQRVTTEHDYANRPECGNQKANISSEKFESQEVLSRLETIINSHRNVIAVENSEVHIGGNAPYMCEKCGCVFSEKEKLQGHLQSHHDFQSIILESSNASLPNLIRKTRESRDDFVTTTNSLTDISQSDTQFRCSKCSRMFIEKDLLEKHISSEHLQDSSFFTCSYCGQEFTYLRSLEMHILIHKPKRYRTCNICDKKFVYSSALKKHLLTHVSAKLERCEYCGYTVKHKSSLQQHIKKWHMNVVKFVCEACNKFCWNRRNLERHIIRVHRNQKTEKELEVECS